MGRCLLALPLFAGMAAEAQRPVRPPTPVREPPVIDSLRRARADSLRADSLARRRAAGDTLVRARRDTGATAADSVKRSAARDSAELRLRDSLLAVLRGDTIRTAFTVPEQPVGVERTGRWSYTREQIAELGAVSLADVLERVPGITTFRGGWLAGVSVASYVGDATRVRVFLDGVALDATDQRSGGVLNLTDIPLWLVQDLTIERGASEIRIWLRSWSQTSTVPYTRVEVNSGDLQTNRFAGAFGKRFGNGAGFQVAAQQLSSSGGRSPIGTGRGAGDGTHQQVFARVGWARGDWSLDGMTMGSLRTSDSLVRTTGFRTLPRFDGQRRDGYLRLGYRSPERDGLWAQVVGGTLRTSFVPTRAANDTAADAIRPDSSRWNTQLASTVGYRRGALSASATQRLRTAAGVRTASPAARVSWEGRWLTVSGYTERHRPDSTERTDLSARLQLRRWLVLSGAIGRYATRYDQLVTDTVRPPGDTTRRLRAPTLPLRGLAARGEAQLRVGTAWITAGLLRQEAISTLGLRLFGDTAFRAIAPPTTGFYGGLETPLYKAIRLSLSGTRWSQSPLDPAFNPQLYRPNLQTRAELSVQSRWLSRFPRGDFGINTRIIHEYRSEAQFVDTLGGSFRLQPTDPSQALSFLLELRLKTAVLGWGYRFAGGPAFQQVPGLPMPRPLQYYGVRWEFWN